MKDEETPLCPNCGKPLDSDGKRVFGYCSPKCRDKHAQEVRDGRKISREAAVLIRQYEQQTQREKKG